MSLINDSSPLVDRLHFENNTDHHRLCFVYFFDFRIIDFASFMNPRMNTSLIEKLIYCDGQIISSVIYEHSDALPGSTIAYGCHEDKSLRSIGIFCLDHFGSRIDLP